MSEFQRWSSQHRTIRAARDWNALLDHGLVKPASYIIRKNGSYVEAINGSTGKIDYGGQNNAGGVSGTDASAVIQSALNNLISGRTWKEKVILKGDFEINDTLSISSYTIFQLEGRIIASSTFDTSKDLVQIGSLGSWTSDVDLVGGLYDGNARAQDVIHMEQYTSCSVRDLKVRNARRHCIAGIFDNTSNFINVHANAAGQGGVEGDCFHFESIAHDDFVSCFAANGSFNGFSITKQSGGAASTTISIIGGTVNNLDGYGVYIKNVNGLEVYGLNAEDVSKSLYYISSCYGIRIFGGRINSPTGDYDTIFITNDTIAVDVLGVHFSAPNASRYDVYIDDVTGTQIDISVAFCALSSAGVYNGGVGTKLYANRNFITENSGNSIIPANTKSHQISFEIARTPTIVDVTPQFDVSGRWWISNISWASGTSILSGAFNFNRTYSGLYSGIIHWNAEYRP